MKWLAFILALLAFTACWRTASAKAPRVVTLAESEVATVSTAPGYTTILQFDSRPTSAVLGDQDAYKVEYVGNGLALKPLMPHVKTNLFVFTDYDRFNFRLVAGGAADAEYLLKVRRKGYSGYPVTPVGEQSKVAPESPAQPNGTKLIRRKVGRKAICGGLTLAVQTLAWPESESTLLVEFRAEVARALVAGKDLRFEPGDFDVSQGGRSVPIETLYMNTLTFTRAARIAEGTIVLRQSALRPGVPLQLRFSPDAIAIKRPDCIKVSFSRSAPARTPSKSTKS